MAKREHVRLVKRGAEAIREWRREHPRERLDLSGADLSGANLRSGLLYDADLRGAQLRGADLRAVDLSGDNLTGEGGADLTRADLEGADLSGADLHRAWLGEAELFWVDLTGTDLRQADLSGAVLGLAVLRGAELQGANVSGAIFGVTVFADCDLSSVRGLDTARHRQPSSFDVDTLAHTLQGSGGQFTPNQRAFFEGAGVPKTLLDYLPSLLESQPIQFFSCFVSHGVPDEAFADRLYEDLREHGLRCWKYDEDALVGRGVWANIDRAIVLHDKAIVICSESSLQRPGVQREIERALQREDERLRQKAATPDVQIDTDVLVPVRLDDYVLTGWEHPRKADVAAKHIGDFRGWDTDEKSYQRAMQQLLRALDPRSKLGLSVGPGPVRPV